MFGLHFNLNSVVGVLKDTVVGASSMIPVVGPVVGGAVGGIITGIQTGSWKDGLAAGALDAATSAIPGLPFVGHAVESVLGPTVESLVGGVASRFINSRITGSLVDSIGEGLTNRLANLGIGRFTIGGAIQGISNIGGGIIARNVSGTISRALARGALGFGASAFTPNDKTVEQLASPTVTLPTVAIPTTGSSSTTVPGGKPVVA